MIDEKELTELMTKSGEAYFRNDVEEGNLYAKEIIHKLDFLERRDQNVLLNVLTNALVRNNELCVIDELHDAGFDFNMKIGDWDSLSLFFIRYPKFNSDSEIFKKMAEYGANSIEDSISSEKLHNLFEKNMYNYNFWWEETVPFYSGTCKKATDEQNKEVIELVKKISANSAEKIGNKGISVFHHTVLHNFREAAEILLKSGVNINVKGAKGRGSSDDGYMGTTPLQLACYMGNLEMVRLLVDNGADTSICDDRGRNSLHYLSYLNFDRIISCSSGQEYSIAQRADIVPLLKCDINARDEDGLTPLLYLEKNSWTKITQFMTEIYIKNGADLTLADKDGNTALILSAENNHITSAMKIMKSKDIINQQNNNGDTALHIAARNGNFEIAYMLIETGADYKIKNNQGETAESIIEESENEKLCNRISKKRPEAPSVLAKMINEEFFNIGSNDNDRLEFAIYLIEKMMKNIDEDDDEDVSNVIEILHYALQEDPDMRVIDAIVNSGFDLMMKVSYQGRITTVRDYCLNVSFYGVGVIKRLVELGIDMDIDIVHGKTPANIVAGFKENHRIRCSYLGEKPSVVADPYAEAAEFFSAESMEALDSEGKSALHRAAQENHIEMMRVMLNKGTDINIAEDSEKMSGTTPLEIACIYGNVEMVKLLKEHGADDSIKSIMGNTAAHYAVKEIESYIKVNAEKRAEIVELLDNIDIPRDDGKTPLILLQTYYMNFNAVNLITPILIDKGADVNHADNDGNTALIIHTDMHCSRDIVKEFIRAGANLNAKNKTGNTALHYALRNGNTDVARLLIKKGADYEIANNDGITPVDIAVEKGYETVLDLIN